MTGGTGGRGRGGGLQTAVSSGGDLAFMPPQPILVPELREQRDSAVQAIVTLDDLFARPAPGSARRASHKISRPWR